MVWVLERGYCGDNTVESGGETLINKGDSTLLMLNQTFLQLVMS